MYTPETISRIEQLRSFAQSRKLSLEEQQEAIRIIRGERVGAAHASAGAKAKKSAALPVDGANVLAGLLASLKPRS